MACYKFWCGGEILPIEGGSERSEERREPSLSAHLNRFIESGAVSTIPRLPSRDP